MPPERRVLSLFLISSILLTFGIMATIPSARAVVSYSISQEWAQVTVNKNWSIETIYNITVTYLSGSPQGIVTVGMPKSFQVLYAHDISGSNLQCSDVSSGGFYGVDVTLKSPIVLNRPNTFIVCAHVPRMVSEDSVNQGNVVLGFQLSTFDTATGAIGSTRIAIILPQGVPSSEIEYLENPDNVFWQGNNLVAYWEGGSAERVSFPEKYMDDITPPSLTIIAPFNSSTINSSPMAVIWNGTDVGSGIDHYEVRLDEGVWWVNEASQTSYTFSGLKDGRHTVYIKAFDKIGNTNQRLVTFTVDTSLTHLLTIVGILSAAVAILSVAIFLLIKRRS
jgi:hypothetical protein